MHFVPIVFALAGALMVYLGFRLYREYRIVADTPLLPVRSLRPGLIRVRGKTAGDDRLTSPLTRVPCFFYHVAVTRRAGAGKERKWVTVAGEDAERPFYVDDGTAKVLVQPRGATYSLLQTLRAEMQSNAIRNRFVEPSLGVAGPSDEDLRAYIPNYYSRARAGARAALEPTNTPIAFQKAVEKVLAADEWYESKGVDLSVSGGLTFEFGGHTYHFTEDCLLAGRECYVFGTCFENPSPKDDCDRNLIQQGQIEKTFQISSFSEEQPEKDIRRRALLAFLVSAAAMMIGVYFILHDAKIL